MTFGLMTTRLRTARGFPHQEAAPRERQVCSHPDRVGRERASGRPRLRRHGSHHRPCHTEGEIQREGSQRPIPCYQRVGQPTGTLVSSLSDFVPLKGSVILSSPLAWK